MSAANTFPTLTQPPQTIGLAPLEQKPDGAWLVRGYAEARQILMGDVRQAGFKAEIVEKMPGYMSKPVLYQHGQVHREQRSQTARFFTPAAVQQRHMPLIEAKVDEIIRGFERQRRADLNQLAALLATSVVAEVVGLTAAPNAALAGRLDSILHADLNYGGGLAGFFKSLKVQLATLNFYYRDVAPAVRARRKQPGEDVISYLLEKNYSGAEIMAECITYGAAGMVTTQEFICVAAWHLLREDGLRRRFLEGEREARHDLLHELLRLEPVVGSLYRRAASELALTSGSETRAFSAGTLFELDLRAINTDARLLGADPLDFNPQRELEKGLNNSVMGFGSGPHRCAGEHIAIAETDVFLRRLMALPGLRVEAPPKVGYNDTIKGYDLRGFWLSLD